MEGVGYLLDSEVYKSCETSSVFMRYHDVQYRNSLL